MDKKNYDVGVLARQVIQICEIYDLTQKQR